MRQFIMIFVLMTAPIMQGMAQQAAAAIGSTTITSKTLDFDYKRYIAVFKGNVEVDDSQVNIQADEMRVFFDGTNSIKAVTAIGNVRIKQADKTATCSKAIYTAVDGQIVMTGKVVLKSDGDTIDGDRIIIWTNEERMICEPARLIIKPSANGDKSKSTFPARKTKTEPPKAGAAKE